MKKLFFSLAGILMLSGLNAQITINRSDYAQAGDWYFIGTMSQNVNIDVLKSGGANLTWDFTNSITADVWDTSRFYDASSYPGAPAAANLVEERVTAGDVTFYNATNSGVKMLVEEPMIGLSAALNIIKFPISYGNAFMDSANATLRMLATDLGMPSNPLFDSALINITIKIDAKVDAWGTLKLKSGTFNSLRQRVTQSMIPDVYIRNTFTKKYVPLSSIPGAPSIPVDPPTKSYVWMGANSGNFLLSVSMDTIDNPETAEYLLSSIRMPTGVSAANNISAFNSFPNPANNELNVDFSLIQNSNVKLAIFDLSGRNVQEIELGLLSAGTQSANINTSAFNPGVYFYKLQSGSASQMQKFIIVR